MSYKRIHVRVPICYNAVLSSKNNIIIEAKTINISQGGFAVFPPNNDFPVSSYDIVVEVENDFKIEFSATLIRQKADVLAFKTTSINDKNLQLIQDLVFKYQETEDFINQILEHNILDDWFVDEDGNEIEIAFQSNSRNE